MTRISLSVLAAVAWLLAGSISASAATVEAVQLAIAQILNDPRRLPLPLERVRSTLKTHYVQNGAQPYWLSAAHSLPFIQRLQAATYDGLDPESYPASPLIELAKATNSGDAGAAARQELYFSAFFIAYATDLKTGRVTPQNVDPNLFRSRKTIDGSRLLSDVWAQPNPSKFLTSFEPKNQHYQTLKRMLKVYTDVIRSGVTWPIVSDGTAIQPGSSDPRILQVRNILAITGDLQGSSATSPTYEPSLVAAVRRFQVRHGLEAKGLIGKQTIMALNTSPQERQRQIILNMERWRWMPDVLGADHFLINIAGFELERIENNSVVDRMNVVVGAVATQTPEFSGAMQYVELNPTWTVPYNIATKEMLPKLRTSPFAYAQEFDIFAGGRISSWSGINWNAYGPGNFPFTFRQRPGPSNALGKVKFMLPNSHNIYLHDTPAKDKFANTTRAFSHGCIRLSKPEELAYSLLGSKLGMSQTMINDIWAIGQTKQINLPAKIPVHLVYATAFATDNGIEFRPDVYGRDRKLAMALFGRPQG